MNAKLEIDGDDILPQHDLDEQRRIKRMLTEKSAAQIRVERLIARQDARIAPLFITLASWEAFGR